MVDGSPYVNMVGFNYLILNTYGATRCWESGFSKILEWKVINIAGVVVNYFLAPLLQERFSLLCCSVNKILRTPRLDNPAKPINLNGLTSLSDKSAESLRYRSDNKRWAIKESLLA